MLEIPQTHKHSSLCVTILQADGVFTHAALRDQEREGNDDSVLHVLDCKQFVYTSGAMRVKAVDMTSTPLANA